MAIGLVILVVGSILHILQSDNVNVIVKGFIAVVLVMAFLTEILTIGYAGTHRPNGP